MLDVRKIGAGAVDEVRQWCGEQEDGAATLAHVAALTPDEFIAAWLERRGPRGTPSDVLRTVVLQVVEAEYDEPRRAEGWLEVVLQVAVDSDAEEGDGLARVRDWAAYMTEGPGEGVWSDALDRSLSEYAEQCPSLTVMIGHGAVWSSYSVRTAEDCDED